jgi:hypothetical protein
MANKKGNAPIGEPKQFDQEIESLRPLPLPDDLSELSLLRRNVSDAIAFLNEFASALRAESKVFWQSVDAVRTRGGDPLVHLGELPFAEPAHSQAVRWDWIGQFLSGPQQLAVLILRRTLVDECQQIEKRQRLLSPAVAEEIANQLGVKRPANMTEEHFIQQVSRNFSTFWRIEEDQNVIVGLELTTRSLKELETRIIDKQEEADFLFAGWKSPAEWIKIFAEYGEPMSETTWRRRIKDGTYQIHPKSTTKRIAIRKGCLPHAYREKLASELS